MKAGEAMSVPSTECIHAKAEQTNVKNALIWFSALIKWLLNVFFPTMKCL